MEVIDYSEYLMLIVFVIMLTIVASLLATIRKRRMNFMTCTTCQAVVQVNPTGTCLRCQKGFTSEPQEDEYQFHDDPADYDGYNTDEDILRTRDKVIKKALTAAEAQLRPKPELAVTKKIKDVTNVAQKKPAPKSRRKTVKKKKSVGSKCSE